MADQWWFYDSDGRSVGPFRSGDLRQLVAAGFIRVDTVLSSESSVQLPVADVLARNQSPASGSDVNPPTPSVPPFAPPPAPLLPPPPPPPVTTSQPVYMLLRESVSHLWNPDTIGWLGLLFSPLWSGIMAAFNARQLGTGESVWRPVIHGAISAGVCLLCSLWWESFWSPALVYCAAVWLIWLVELQPQSAAFEQFRQTSPQVGNWFLPAIAGTPAAMLVVLLLVVEPTLPWTPRQVCEHFVQASSLKDAKGLTTLNLWPALTALDQSAALTGTTQYEFTHEENAPADPGGYLVAYRMRTETEQRTETVDGVFHLLQIDGRWKIEEIYYTAFDSQPFQEWIALSRQYPQIAAGTSVGQSVAASSTTSNTTVPDTEINSGNTWNDYWRRYGSGAIQAGRSVQNGGLKKFFAGIAALIAALAGLGRLANGSTTARETPDSSPESSAESPRT